MPASAIAALTLGVMQTKDHTVQAAMGLRLLGISQSVVFFAPPEVHQSILNVRNKRHGDVLDSRDVIIWLLEQTCCNIEQLQPLYISQGLDYCHRQLQAKMFPAATTDPEQRKAYLRALQQTEDYSLDKLYSLNQRTKATVPNIKGNSETGRFIDRLQVMKHEMRDTSDTMQALAHQEVEQEREVEVEVETVREIQKPFRANPLPQPPLHKDLVSFVQNGRLTLTSHVFQQAFFALRCTCLGERLGISDSALKSRLYVTQDFDNTVTQAPGKFRDQYSRPVHWILWSTTAETAVIISDFEADALLPFLRTQKSPCTYLITYSAPTNRAMLIFDTLKFYTVPPLPSQWQAPTWLVRDLGIFAGRFYFDYDSQHQAVYESLGLPVPRPSEASSVPAADIPEIPKSEPFSKEPLQFMQEWLAIRRKGQDFSQTMMGEICRGRVLVKEETRGGVQEGSDNMAETKEVQEEREGGISDGEIEY